MEQRSAQKAAPQFARAQQPCQALTLEHAAALTLTATQADKISTAFGVDPVDFHGIREGTEEQIALSVKVLEPNVNETAMRIHL